MSDRGIRLKRLLLIALLVLSSGPAYAEWVSVGGYESQGGYTAYVDPDTIRRKGDLVKLWRLINFKTTQTVAGDSFLSVKEQTEFDCTEGRMRGLALAAFSGNSGTGDVVYSQSVEQKWEPVFPGSVGQDMWKVACGKK